MYIYILTVLPWIIWKTYLAKGPVGDPSLIFEVSVISKLYGCTFFFPLIKATTVCVIFVYSIFVVLVKYKYFLSVQVAADYKSVAS